MRGLVLLKRWWFIALALLLTAAPVSLMGGQVASALSITSQSAVVISGGSALVTFPAGAFIGGERVTCSVLLISSPGVGTIPPSESTLLFASGPFFAESNGSFMNEIPIPPGVPAGSVVRIRCTGSSARVAQADFLVSDAVGGLSGNAELLSGADVRPGGLVTLRCTGFLPGEEVRAFVIGIPRNSRDGRVDIERNIVVSDADSDGVARATVRIPANVEPDTIVRVDLRGQTSGRICFVDGIRVSGGGLFGGLLTGDILVSAVTTCPNGTLFFTTPASFLPGERVNIVMYATGSFAANVPVLFPGNLTVLRSAEFVADINGQIVNGSIDVPSNAASFGTLRLEARGLESGSVEFADNIPCFGFGAVPFIPEADVLVLFGSGLAGLGGYAALRVRSLRRRLPF